MTTQQFLATTYHEGVGGYYRSGHGRLMHREVYRSEYGNIPHGWEVHHKDHDRSNNHLGNLECLPAGEHRRMPKYPPTFTEMAFICVNCGCEYLRKASGGRPFKFCSHRCKLAHYRRTR